METQICRACTKELPITKFKKQYNKPHLRARVCHVCNGSKDREKIRNTPERLAKYQNARKAVLIKWPFTTKICGYQAFDRNNGYQSLTQKEGRGLFLSATECVYCGNTNRRDFGLDRRDNDSGHSIDNVVICCELCNVLLIDLPPEVKDILSAGLRESRSRGLLDAFVVPAKRKITRKKRNEFRKSV